MDIKIQFFKIDPNNLGRGSGNYYFRGNGIYSKVKEPKINIPFHKMNREHTIKYLQSGGTFKDIPDSELKTIKKNLGFEL